MKQRIALFSMIVFCIFTFPVQSVRADITEPEQGYNVLEMIFFVPAAAVQFMFFDIPAGIAGLFNPVPRRIKKNEAALNQLDWKKRYEAVKNLGDIHKEDAYSILIDSLTDNHVVVSLRAYEELKDAKESVVVPMLVKTLESHDPWTRKLALDLLAHFNNPSVTKNLVFLANDDEREVKLSALLALEDLSEESLIFRYFPVAGSEKPVDNIVNWWYTRGKILEDVKSGGNE